MSSRSRFAPKAATHAGHSHVPGGAAASPTQPAWYDRGQRSQQISGASASAAASHAATAAALAEMESSQ